MKQINPTNYVAPQVKVIRVMMEQGIAVQVSTHVYLHPDWEENEVPIGADTSVEGGDIHLF